MTGTPMVSVFPSQRGNGGAHDSGDVHQPVREPRSLPGRQPHVLAQPQGLLQVNTAPFRGSFGGVLSHAIRSAGMGCRVMVSQFLRGGVNQGPDHAVRLCGGLEWMRPALVGSLHGPSNDPEARAAVQELWATSRTRLMAGSMELMVLDELGLAVQYGLIDEAEAVAALEQRSSRTDLILTGPSMPASFVAMADQVTELRHSR